MADMDIDPSPANKNKKEGKEGKQRFEVKKWNAVSLWAWGDSRSVALPGAYRT
ncbi:hypothetical protein D9615_003287 [Tricholomella constricta]|uniref:Uncharacterized protein n=1 Tax=Tricholomella constricta TaxID=117010 RepID=A0A8H5M7Y3_9AGAR|nr:hypothetical protein D9615_003287 [Tricholomella constricta]